MRAFFIALIALFALLSISCCGSGVTGSVSNVKAVMDDNSGDGGSGTGDDDGSGDTDWIFYDSEGDDFDSADPGTGNDPTKP